MLLVTNKHVRPPLGGPKTIQIRVVVGTGDKAAVKSVDVFVIGADGKYLPTVRLHPTAGFDVAAVNVTEAIMKSNIQGTWLPLDLLSTPGRLKDETSPSETRCFFPGPRQAARRGSRRATGLGSRHSRFWIPMALSVRRDCDGLGQIAKLWRIGPREQPAACLRLQPTASAC